VPLPYRQREVWRRSQELALLVTGWTRLGKWDYFLKDQICRAAFSVPANIAEGNGRSTPLDYAAFVDRARGSLYELDSWLDACHRLELIGVDDHKRALSEIEQLGAMLLALGRSLRKRSTLESR
jgi:four helix bundle protein